MRYMKRLIVSVLVYAALYLPFIALLQASTGYDYTAAYSIGGVLAAVELALSSVIKIAEARETAKTKQASGSDSDTGSEEKHD